MLKLNDTQKTLIWCKESLNHIKDMLIKNSNILNNLTLNDLKVFASIDADVCIIKAKVRVNRSNNFIKSL